MAGGWVPSQGALELAGGIEIIAFLGIKAAVAICPEGAHRSEFEDLAGGALNEGGNQGQQERGTKEFGHTTRGIQDFWSVEEWRESSVATTPGERAAAHR